MLQSPLSSQNLESALCWHPVMLPSLVAAFIASMQALDIDIIHLTWHAFADLAEAHHLEIPSPWMTASGSMPKSISLVCTFQASVPTLPYKCNSRCWVFRTSSIVLHVLQFTSSIGWGRRCWGPFVLIMIISTRNQFISRYHADQNEWAAICDYPRILQVDNIVYFASIGSLAASRDIKRSVVPPDIMASQHPSQRMSQTKSRTSGKLQMNVGVSTWTSSVTLNWLRVWSEHHGETENDKLYKFVFSWL